MFSFIKLLRRAVFQLVYIKTFRTQPEQEANSRSAIADIIPITNEKIENQQEVRRRKSNKFFIHIYKPLLLYVSQQTQKQNKKLHFFSNSNHHLTTTTTTNTHLFIIFDELKK